MDNNFNSSDRYSHSRTSVIVRKSPDEAVQVQSRSHQWSSNPYYANSPINTQSHHEELLNPPLANFPGRFPSVVPNQRNPYFQNVNHYSRRNDDRLTFHSYQNYNTHSYPSSSRPSGSFPPSNSTSAQQLEPNMPQWAYSTTSAPHTVTRPQNKYTPQKPPKPDPPIYNHQDSYTSFNEPPSPPHPTLDLPSEINLSEFEERLPQPSALLRKFATESLKTPMIGRDPNNQSEESPSKFTKMSEDTNLRIDIDEIFSKFSHLANYTTSQEANIESSAILSDGSLSPVAESPIDSVNFLKISEQKKSPMLRNDQNFNYQISDDSKSAQNPLNNEKQDYGSNTSYRETEHGIRMRSVDKSNANTVRVEPMEDNNANNEKFETRSSNENNTNELNDESFKDEKRPVSDCHVCGDRAIAHMHYGGICCYSCKAFFRRAVQNGKDKTYKCKKELDCEVSVNTRRGCQKCRFEKCKEIGMTASWVLSEEQCEIRFGKGKLKRKPNKSGNVLDEDAPMEKLPAHQTNLTTYNQNPYTKEDNLTVVHMMCVYEASKEMIHFSDENVVLSEKIFGKNEKHSYSANDMNSLVATVIKKNIFFMSDNPFFKNLSLNDRKKLLAKNMTEMCHVRGALRFNTNNKSFQWYFSSKDKPQQHGSFTQNANIGEDALKNLYSSKEAARDIITIMDRIARLCLPTEVILILMHVVVFSGDGLQLDNPSFIQDTQVHYLSMLFRFLLNKLPVDEVHKTFSKVMAVLVELRESGDKSNKQKINSNSYSTENESSSE